MADYCSDKVDPGITLSWLRLKHYYKIEIILLSDSKQVFRIHACINISSIPYCEESRTRRY